MGYDGTDYHVYTYKYHCHDYECGASDCGTCRNGSPYEDCEDEDEDRVYEVVKKYCVIIRKARMIDDQQALPGDLVRIKKGFTYVKGGPREYVYRERFEAYGPGHGPCLAGEGFWSSSKGGSYAVHHWKHLDAIKARDDIRRRFAEVSQALDRMHIQYIEKQAEEAVQEFRRLGVEWCNQYAPGANFPWNRSPSSLYEKVERCKERHQRAQEVWAIRKAQPGDRVTLDGEEWVRGKVFYQDRYDYEEERFTSQRVVGLTAVAGEKTRTLPVASCIGDP